MGLLINTKKEADTKLTIEMCSQMIDWKFTASSSGHFHRRPSPLQTCGLSLRQLQKKSLTKHYDRGMYFLNTFF